MSAIAAAYSSYTSLSISQTSAAAADAGTGKEGAASTASLSVSTVSATTVSISYRAKQMLARALSEQSVVDQLQSQLDAFRSGGAAALGAGGDLSGGTDLFEIISGAGDDSIWVHARCSTNGSSSTREGWNHSLTPGSKIRGLSAACRRSSSCSRPWPRMYVCAEPVISSTAVEST